MCVVRAQNGRRQGHVLSRQVWVGAARLSFSWEEAVSRLKSGDDNKRFPSLGTLRHEMVTLRTCIRTLGKHARSEAHETGSLERNGRPDRNQDPRCFAAKVFREPGPSRGPGLLMALELFSFNCKA